MSDLTQIKCVPCRGGEPTVTEAEGHHPAILTEWGKVTVTWWTRSAACIATILRWRPKRISVIQPVEPGRAYPNVARLALDRGGVAY